MRRGFKVCPFPRRRSEAQATGASWECRDSGSTSGVYWPARIGGSSGSRSLFFRELSHVIRLFVFWLHRGDNVPAYVQSARSSSRREIPHSEASARQKLTYFHQNENAF